MSLSVYDDVIGEVFKRAKNNPLLFGGYYFSKDLVEEVVIEKGHSVKNIPDIKYTYDARKSFPQSILDEGHFAIIGAGKGDYNFVELSKPNLISTQDLGISKIYTVSDKTPQVVKEIVGNDEQAMLAAIQHNEILNLLFSQKVFHVQNHLRTTISLGQIEIDSVFITENRKIIPISAKGKNDYLSYTQILNLNRFCSEKYPSYQFCSFGAFASDSTIYLVEFSTSQSIDSIEIIKTVQIKFT